MKLDLSLGKRNFISDKGLKRLIYLHNKAIIYYELGLFCYQKLNGKQPDKEELKFSKIKKLKKHYSNKKLKHYDSMFNNARKKVKKIEKSLKSKCIYCDKIIDFKLVVDAPMNICTECSQELMNWIDN